MIMSKYGMIQQRQAVTIIKFPYPTTVYSTAWNNRYIYPTHNSNKKVHLILKKQDHSPVAACICWEWQYFW